MTEAVAAEPQKKKSGAGAFFKFLVLFILLFFAAGLFYVYSKNVLGIKETLEVNYAAEPVRKTKTVNVSVVKQVAPAAIAPAPVETATLIPVQAQDKRLALYVAAKDLRDSVNDTEEFTKNIEFVKLLASDQPEILGKISTLELYAKEVPTKYSIKSDLLTLRNRLDEQKADNFFANIEKSFMRMVRISKIEGDVKAGDYSSIIKRTELAVEGGNYNLASSQISKLGKEGNDIATKLSILINVNEITASVLDMARAKLVM